MPLQLLDELHDEVREEDGGRADEGENVEEEDDELSAEDEWVDELLEGEDEDDEAANGVDDDDEDGLQTVGGLVCV